MRGEIEALYRRRYGKFFRVALAIVGDEGRARDAVQEGFANALRAAERFEGAQVEGWVWRIIVNAALGEIRGRRDWELLDESVGTDVEETFDALVVREWLGCLPERQRLAVFLRHYADLDYRSIAQVLEIEVGTVSATLSQAYTAMRRQLKEVER